MRESFGANLVKCFKRLENREVLSMDGFEMLR